MGKGNKKMGMPGNMGNMMKQVQQMQKQMQKMQAELEEKELEATAGGGAIAVKVNGKKEIVEIKINPEVIDPDDAEMLQDLIMAAINEALRKVDEMTAGEMGKLTGGLSIPGMF